MAQTATGIQPLSSGVDELIARLREEGVAAGRAEGARLLEEAQAEAQQVLENAKTEAREYLDTSRKEVDAYRSAGDEALKTAMRDTVLEMKGGLKESFSADVKRLVSQELKDPDLMRQMILEIAGCARKDAGVSDDKALHILLPEPGFEALQQDASGVQHDELTRYALGLTGEMLRKGVTFSASGDVRGGIRVLVKERDLVIDMTEEAIAALILDHLQPRFRAVLEGVVR